jgi:hypothetical protein
MAVADTIDEHWLEVAMHLPAVRFVVEIIGRDEAVQFWVIVGCPIDAVLMVAERQVRSGA